MDHDGRWPAVLATAGGVRRWFEDHGHPMAAYTDKQIATALLATSPPGGARLWLSPRHMNQTLTYLRTEVEKKISAAGLRPGRVARPRGRKLLPVRRRR